MLLIQSSNPLNGSVLIFPALEVIHITGFAILVGSIAIMDFRLLGAGLKNVASPDLYKDLSPWTLMGLVLMLISGPLMFSSDPDMYYLNWAFLIKMGFLLVAIVFNYTVHRKVARAEVPSSASKAVAGISLFLWAAVIFGGISIGFVAQGL